MQLQDYIKPELLILVPVLYIIGTALKQSEFVKDKSIPLILGLFGVLLATAWTVASSPIINWQNALNAGFTGITQGILTTGASVYTNQLIKQITKINRKK